MEKTDQTLDLPSPHSSHNSEQYVPQITHHKLTGHYYVQWSQSVLMFICGRSKEEYLNGGAKEPKLDDLSHKEWKATDSMVKTWLISSMNQEISEDFLMCHTAADIWDEARSTYSSSDNTSELFETESLVYELHQGDKNVTQFYSQLTRMWQKIDLYEKHNWACSDDKQLFNRVTETKRVFKFLSGLNKELDEKVEER
ncbi:uncharacterized protein [Primulina huaijiensis]|uniref:uncharacterized protein n=1 Tax=Primulina huaijiensis TaxID=1492673 RepID=UPI003CC6EDE3